MLEFLRRSVVARSITPDFEGKLHFIWTRQASQSFTITEEEGAFWGSTIGNTFLSTLSRRPKQANDWDGFKEHLIPTAVTGEWTIKLKKVKEWNASAVEKMGADLASAAGDIWYQQS